MNKRPTHPGDAQTPQIGAAFTPSGAANEPAPAQSWDPWRTTLRELRGRYRLAIMLAATGAIVGAGAGAMFGKRLYSAGGLVRIASTLPQVMRETDQNKPLANFEGFMQAQRDVITSREMILTALQDESWRALDAHAVMPTDEQFAAGLKVDVHPRSDHLRVTFTDKDPAVAAVAVRSIIGAFQRAFVSEQGRLESQRTGQLTARRESLQTDLHNVQTRIASVAQGRTCTEIEPLSSAALERLKKLRGALADVQCALAGGPDLTPRPAAPSRSPAEMVADENYRFWSTEQSRVENQLAQLVGQGFGPGHPTVIKLIASAKECRSQVARCTEANNTRRASVATPPVMSLTDREANLICLTKAAEDEVKQFAVQRSQLKLLEEQAVAVRQSLMDTETRLDALATEASLGGRLTVISGGDKPMAALLDNRVKFAALGAATGFVAPLFALVLLTSHRRRYRYCDELAADLMGRVPFVAAIPDIGEPGALNAVAAHCVHDLHVRLQPTSATGSRVYLVTSASAGEGKTSLTVALGLSFAVAGFKTLLIDGDLTTRRLTRGFDCDDQPGLFEAASDEEPGIRQLRTGLSILPVGRCPPQDAWKMAPSATSRLLAAVRDQFDVVLIDSDPILTGIRASVLAPQVDGVILTLAHGQEHGLAESAVRHIGMLGATLACAVLNRADESEFRAALKEQPHSPALGGRRLPEKLNRFGPLVATMLSSLSLSRESDLDLSPTGPVLAQADPVRRAA